MLKGEDFKSLIRNGVLLSFDLVIKDHKGRILLGYRTQSPAKDHWFVPGGRVFKNETMDEAIQRISLDEIGFSINADIVTLKGIYEHIYDDNYFGDPDFNTHYIVIALEYHDNDSKISLPSGDKSHSKFKFETIANILRSEDVHQYTKNYFIDSPSNLFKITL